MTKKTILTLILCCFIISCGKKGDPLYKNPEKKAKNPNIFLKKA